MIHNNLLDSDKTGNSKMIHRIFCLHATRSIRNTVVYIKNNPVQSI